MIHLRHFNRDLVAAHLVLLLAATVGCATRPFIAYEGRRRPAQDVAIVEAAGKAQMAQAYVGGKKIHIFAVDDVRAEVQPGKVEPIGRWEILPGKHSVTAGLDTKSGFLLSLAMLGGWHEEWKAQTVFFEARAGRTYTVCGDATYHPPKLYLWVIDQETRAVVGGGKPPGKTERLRE